MGTVLSDSGSRASRIRLSSESLILLHLMADTHPRPCPQLTAPVRAVSATVRVCPLGGGDERLRVAPAASRRSPRHHVRSQRTRVRKSRTRKGLVERATGIEPATFSLGSWRGG